MATTQTDRLYGASSGVAVKAPVAAVTNGTPLPLTGLTSVGGYVPNVGDRILVKDQADPTTNGIYNASTSAWQRAGDFDGPYDCVQGTLVVALFANAQSLIFQLTTPNPVIGTSPLTFQSYVNPNVLYPQTPAEVAANVNPVFGFYPEGDGRRYGASNAAADNSGAFNTALLVSAKGGNAAFVPPSASGYKITSTLNATLTCSMYGMGQASALLPQACDGITFTNQGTFYGSRFFRDFVITGTGTNANRGIVALMTAASGGRIEGALFQNLSIQNFQYGVYGYGYYHCDFIACYLAQNTNGFWFVEQSIKVALIGCQVIKSPIATHGDGSIGLNCDQLGGVRPQDIQAFGCLFYGHDINISLVNLLFGGIHGCDCDQSTTTGISATTVNGGLTIDGNWVNTNANAATTGIAINTLGAPINDIVVVNNNQVSCTQANAGSIGMFLGGNQLGVTANSNAITGFATGESIVASHAVSKFNSINASGTAVLVNSSATDVEVGPNNVQAGTPLAFTSLTPVGLSYYGRGTFTLTMSAGASGAAGTVGYTANGHHIALTVPAAGIQGAAAGTALTGSGLPQFLWPNTDQSSKVNTIDNSLGAIAFCKIAAATGLMTFSKNANGDAFTASGNRGVNGDTLTYTYS